ncbi:MAG TPA: glucose 1-dehydrogenase [Candidatus Acidoferrum sp.]
MDKLKNKVAVVTGAARGIGAAIANAFAAEGAVVAVNYASSKQQAEQVVRGIEDRKGSAMAIKADISNRGEAIELFGRVQQAYGRVDVLVNNAAFYEFRALDSIDEQHFRKQFDVNVLGLLFATQEAVKLMLSGGSVVNISSVAAITPLASGAVYCATKAAVDVLTRALAQELGPRKIRINSLAPGMTNTERARAGGSDEFRKFAISRTPLGRIGEPGDIAKAAVFLASDESDWITGEVVVASGGLRF